MQLQHDFHVFQFQQLKKDYLACRFSMYFHSFVQIYQIDHGFAFIQLLVSTQDLISSKSYMVQHKQKPMKSFNFFDFVLYYISSHRILVKLSYEPHPAKHYIGLYKFTGGPRDADPFPSNFNPCHHAIKTPLWTTPGEALHACTLQNYRWPSSRRSPPIEF